MGIDPIVSFSGAEARDEKVIPGFSPEAGALRKAQDTALSFYVVPCFILKGSIFTKMRRRSALWRAFQKN